MSLAPKYNENILDSYTFGMALGLKRLSEGDRCHVVVIGNHNTDNAVYLGPWMEDNANQLPPSGDPLQPAGVIGMRFQWGESVVELLFNELIECWSLGSNT
jgi:hypothetical protein